MSQLNFWQKQAIERLSNEALWEWVCDDFKAKIPDAKRALFLETVKPNIQFPHDFDYWVHVCFTDTLSHDAKNIDVLRQAGHAYFDQALGALERHHNDLDKVLNELKTELGVKGKALYQPLRVALTGVEHGPELGKLFLLIEPTRIRRRLENAKC